MCVRVARERSALPYVAHVAEQLQIALLSSYERRLRPATDPVPGVAPTCAKELSCESAI